MDRVYSCDTSTLLQSWRFDYRPRVFAGIWRRIETLIAEGRLIATAEVLVELDKHDDEVAKWARKHGAMFIPIDEEIQNEVKAILRKHPRLIDTRRGRSGADPFVIALGKIRTATVLTDEVPSGSIEKPKIPDVCADLGIECCRLVDLLENEGFTFDA